MELCESNLFDYLEYQRGNDSDFDFGTVDISNTAGTGIALVVRKGCTPESQCKICGQLVFTSPVG